MSEFRPLPYILLLPLTKRAWGQYCPHCLCCQATSFCVFFNSVDFPSNLAQLTLNVKMYAVLRQWSCLFRMIMPLF